MIRVLMISFYFDPYPGVGAKRVSYWALNGRENGLEVEVITTTDQGEINRSIPVHCVPVDGSNKRFFDVIKEPGAKWSHAIKTYVENNFSNKKFDVVLMSGGPFLQFKLGKYLKQKFSAKLVLDFRDPFANNPRFNNSSLKKFLKSRFENSFIKPADLLISVNHFCLNLIKVGNKRTAVIENGYDEKLVPSVYPVTKKIDRFVLAHAGSLYMDRDPRTLMSCIKNYFTDKLVFQQFGSEPEVLEKYKNQEFYSYEGSRSYQELMKELMGADACVLITQGDPFESTTKIFDYIALNKKVLIITNGKVKTGNLHEITKDYPNVFWSENKEIAIKEELGKLMKAKIIDADPTPYSRKRSLEKLSKELKLLVYN